MLNYKQSCGSRSCVYTKSGEKHKDRNNEDIGQMTDDSRRDYYVFSPSLKNSDEQETTNA